MDYLKHFYRSIESIMNPKSPLRTNYYYKPNYLIKNAKYHSIFKDEFGNFNSSKYYKPVVLEEKKEELM